LRGYDTNMQDLVVTSFYKKRLDSISQPTRDFRAYLRSWYSPFMFEACTESMQPIGRPLLKFRAKQLDEESLPTGSPDRVLLGLDQPAQSNSRRDIDATKWRAETLKLHFPVTLARLGREDLAPLLDEANALGFQRWQIQQAAANLALSSDISSGRPHYAGLQRATIGDRIVAALRARHEAADSSDLGGKLAGGRLLKQLVLDANALLKSVGLPTTSSHEQTIARLRDSGLLETGHRTQ
jgi:hypothetical protein